MDTHLPAVGRVLRGARSRAGVTQLELSNRTGVSTRHLSTIETGRAEPTAALLARLADALALPRTTRDDLMRAAGFADTSPRGGTPDEAGIRAILDGLHPVAAIALDSDWSLIAANASFDTLITAVVGAPLARGENLFASMFGAGGIGDHVLDADEVRASLMARLDRQRAVTADPRLDALAYTFAGQIAVTHDAPVEVAMLMRVRTTHGIITVRITPMVPGLPHTSAQPDLAIELFTPADAPSAAVLAQLGLGG